jgi:hypothetical protein
LGNARKGDPSFRERARLPGTSAASSRSVFNAVSALEAEKDEIEKRMSDLEVCNLELDSRRQELEGANEAQDIQDRLSGFAVEKVEMESQMMSVKSESMAALAVKDSLEAIVFDLQQTIHYLEEQAAVLRATSSYSYRRL